jgi:predicted outer membrane repeat protein
METNMLPLPTRSAMSSRLAILTICTLLLAGILTVHASGARASAVCNIAFTGTGSMATVANLQTALDVSGSPSGACNDPGDEVIVTFTGNLTWTVRDPIEWYYPADLTLQGSAVLNGNEISPLFDIQSFTAGSNPLLTVEGLTMKNAEGDGNYGGALYIGYQVDAEIVNATFLNNGNGGGYGAAIGSDQSDSTISITRSLFQGNSSGDGGAIYAEGDLFVEASTFESNDATNGGAIQHGGSGKTLEVSTSTFSANSATSEGGAIWSAGVLDVTGSTVSGNSANQAGGGVSANNEARFLNSTIVSNQSRFLHGGGIYMNFDNPLYLDFSTIVSNQAVDGANIYFYDSDSRPTIRGSVIGNPSGGGENCESTGVVTAGLVVDSFIDEGAMPSSCGAGFTGASWSEIALGDLANNGGSTQTLMPASDSVLIGAVSDPTVTALTSVDQRGYARSGDYTAGAVEWSASPPEADLSQLPKSWYQAYERSTFEEVCMPEWTPSWALWPRDGSGGWTCERTVWWSVRLNGWVDSPGFR